MPSDYSERIDQARAVPVLAVMKNHGFESGRREGKSIHFDKKGSAWRINITGQKWFDHKNGKGGFGAIDLEMHLSRRSFKEAVNTLLGDKQSFSTAELKRKPKVADKPALSFSEQLDRYADKTPHRWTEARNYLVNERKLSPKIVDQLHEQGSLYPNQYGASVFVHHDLNGQMKGVTVRPSRDTKRFHMALGSKQEGFFRCGNLHQDPIAITESPIDAISYYQLHGRPAVATGGLFLPQKFVEHIRKNNPRVILAFDNDEKKETLEGVQRVTDLLKSESVRFELHSPVSKDWNQDLKNLVTRKALRKH